MREYIQIYKRRNVENSPLFLGEYPEEHPFFERAHRILVSLPEDCTLENLILSAETALNLVSGELDGKLHWGPLFQVITDDSATPIPLMGVQIFRKKLKNLHDVAFKKFRWIGHECSFESQEEVIRWLYEFIDWATSKLPANAPESGGSPPRTNATSKKNWDADATALFIKNPTMNKKELAEQLGANEKSLAPKRCPMLTNAIKAYKGTAGNRPKGTKDKDGNLEAWDG